MDYYLKIILKKKSEFHRYFCDIGFQKKSTNGDISGSNVYFKIHIKENAIDFLISLRNF